MRFGLVIAILFMAVIPCGAQPAPPYRLAVIQHCIGAFAPGACTVTAISSGAEITSSQTVSTTGESIHYIATTVSERGELGGSVSVVSDTSNSAGPGVMVDALDQFVDVVTVSFEPWNGSTGYVGLYYTLDGTNTATGANVGARFGPHGVPYACVKLGINAPIFLFGCAAHDQPVVGGRFFAGVFPFTYGVAYPLWFQLETIAGTGFGAGRATGQGTSVANFKNTATIAGLVFYDSQMNPIEGTATIASAAGAQYQQFSAVPSPPIDADGATVFAISRGVIPVRFTLIVNVRPRANYHLRPSRCSAPEPAHPLASTQPTLYTHPRPVRVSVSTLPVVSTCTTFGRVHLVKMCISHKSS